VGSIFDPARRGIPRRAVFLAWILDKGCLWFCPQMVAAGLIAYRMFEHEQRGN
jgi:hypothetical protein